MMAKNGEYEKNVDLY